MTDHQCPSCGGFCKKSGCERRDNIVPCKHFKSGITNKTAPECPYCRIEELESHMQGLSNEINDFQNVIERQQHVMQRAIDAWDTTTHQKNGDGRLWQCMEDLRAESHNAIIKAPPADPTAA